MQPDRYRFGHDVMGPILAECCLLLHRHLESNAGADRHAVLFCARGGLLIHHALNLFVGRIGDSMHYATADFMVSRLAAARLAIDSNDPSTRLLLALELDGKTNSEAAAALAGVAAPSDGDWAAPYESIRFDRLLSEDSRGREIRAALLDEASLLRTHFRAASGGAAFVHLVDTGVFGSIAQYLRVGMPEVSLECVLLFRAHYKRSIPLLDTPHAIGLVCDHDYYRPWDPRSVSRLYWPFFEAFFEPALPSVRRYGVDAVGCTVSNLQISGWRELTQPSAGSMACGAFDYLAGLGPGAIPSIRKNATRAWHAVRRRIVYPDAADIEVMQVLDRGLDFGCDDVVGFGNSPTGRGWRAALASSRASIWPEGELRRQCPRTAYAVHGLLELGRLGAALARLTSERRLI